MSNIVPVMAPAAPKSPKLRLEGLHPDGIDVTWQVPQQCGDAYISVSRTIKHSTKYIVIIIKIENHFINNELYIIMKNN